MKKQGVFLQSASADEAQIDIVGIVGWEVAFTEMRRLFGSLAESVKRVVFNIYSPGGDVWDGNGIVQAIGELGKTRETVARVQVAASMATLIAVACQKRTIASNGRFLIHNAWTVTQGDADDHEKAAQTLRDCESEAARFYAARTGQTEEFMRALMAEERWLTPAEALTLGFVQEIDDPFDAGEVADVRAEIEAAGKWPMALVEMPVATMIGKCIDCGHVQKETNPPCAKCGSQNVKEVDESNASTTDDGAKGDASGADGASGQPAVFGPADIEAAKAHGFTAGKEAADDKLLVRARAGEERVIALTVDLKRVQGLLDASVAESRKLQGERDQARAAVEKHKAALDEANGKLAKLLAGGLTFQPAVETWADALKAAGGDYEKARKQFPEAYRAQREHDKQNRQ
jgi:ATP-dependent protease ClpP protease subunit